MTSAHVWSYTLLGLWSQVLNGSSVNGSISRLRDIQNPALNLTEIPSSLVNGNKKAHVVLAKWWQFPWP